MARDPFLAPDFISKDAAGRDVHHLVAGDYIFDYWIDHAVKQIVITAIDFAD